MSTAAPEGEQSWPPRRRHRFRWLSRLIAVVLALGLVAGAGYAVWHYVLEPTTKSRVSTKPTPKPCPTKKGKPAPLSPRTVRVDVLNHTDRAGLAGETARTLQGIGFTVRRIGNDPVKRAVKGPVELRAGRQSRRQVALLKEYFPGATVHRSSRRNARITIALGKKFQAVRSTAEVKAERRRRAGCPGPRRARRLAAARLGQLTMIIKPKAYWMPCPAVLHAASWSCSCSRWQGVG